MLGVIVSPSCGYPAEGCAHHVVVGVVGVLLDAIAPAEVLADIARHGAQVVDPAALFTFHADEAQGELVLRQWDIDHPLGIPVFGAVGDRRHADIGRAFELRCGSGLLVTMRTVPPMADEPVNHALWASKHLDARDVVELRVRAVSCRPANGFAGISSR